MDETALNYREALVQRLRAMKPRILLDAGTGAGVMTKALSNGLESFIVSVDANRLVFPRVREKIDRTKVDFVECDFAQLPFKEDVFCCVVLDLVISTSHDWDPFSTYLEFKRVLETESSLFITDYYPEELPSTREGSLATKTSEFYRTVMRVKGVQTRQSFSPESSTKQLRRAGFAAVKNEKIRANEPQEWKKRVLEEYYSSMRTEISGLGDFRLKARLMKKLDELKGEIDRGGRIIWGWGANYLIEATK